MGAVPANWREPPPDRRIVAVYDYDGVFKVVRYAPKDFRQWRRDGRRGYVWNLDGVALRLCLLNDKRPTGEEVPPGLKPRTKSAGRLRQRR